MLNILKWLQDNYQCEVVTFTADIGQGEEVEPARNKAQSLGVKEIFIDDLKEEFQCEEIETFFDDLWINSSQKKPPAQGREGENARR